MTTKISTGSNGTPPAGGDAADPYAAAARYASVLAGLANEFFAAAPTVPLSAAASKTDSAGITGIVPAGFSGVRPEPSGAPPDAPAYFDVSSLHLPELGVAAEALPEYWTEYSPEYSSEPLQAAIAAGLPVPQQAPSAGFYFLEESRRLAVDPMTPPAWTERAVPAAHVPAPLPLSVPARPALDAEAIRRDFPILSERVHGRPLVWLDNGATTQKPQAVIDRLAYFYAHENSNIHRAAHELAARATDAYEAARNKVVRFIGASSSDEIVFVRGATEAINLVAQSWGRQHIGPGDEIVVTWLEHHANIVPWQQLCEQVGARLRVAPVDDSGQVILSEYERLLGPRTRLVSFTQVSNALGTVTPAHEMVRIAHRYGARVLVDGAQAVSHMPVDVGALGCDWYVFSGHKMFAPTGIGVLYGRRELLGATQPWQGGGNMIADVTFERTVYQDAPARFEAGTGNIADAVGLGAAIDYLLGVGMENVNRYEHDLLLYTGRALAEVPGLRIVGNAAQKAGVISFVLHGRSSEDVGKALDREGIAVRSGHHCAQPILRRFGLETTVRLSLALYNTCADIDALRAALLRIQAGNAYRR